MEGVSCVLAIRVVLGLCAVWEGEVYQQVLLLSGVSSLQRPPSVFFVKCSEVAEGLRKEEYGLYVICIVCDT